MSSNTEITRHSTQYTAGTRLRRAAITVSFLQSALGSDFLNGFWGEGPTVKQVGGMAHLGRHDAQELCLLEEDLQERNATDR